ESRRDHAERFPHAIRHLGPGQTARWEIVYWTFVDGRTRAPRGRSGARRTIRRKGSSPCVCIGRIRMPFLDQFRIEALPQKWQDEGKHWQETYFPEMPEVLDRPNWSRYDP